MSPLTAETTLKIFGSPDLSSIPGQTFEWRRLCLLMWNPVWNCGDSREIMFDMYGDSRENMLEISAVVSILSPISSVRDMSQYYGVWWMSRVTDMCVYMNESCLWYSIRPKMKKSHSGCPRTAWCVVNMCHKNGMSGSIRTHGTIFNSILYCNFQDLHSRLKCMYSVISVIVDSLPGNTKNRGIDPFVAVGVQFLHFCAGIVSQYYRV